MVEELKLAIKVDDDSIEQSLLKQFANAQKMADKVVLDFKNVNFDDKEIEAKFKALQKKAGQNPIDLSVSKDTIQMLSQISDKLGDIFKIAQGKSIIDSSSTIKEIDKINKSLNKTSEILNKSFLTKNKTEAFNQLKEASVAYEKFYGNEKAMATQEGTQAAYNYYKAYEEALKKGVAQTRLEKVTIDVEKGYNFNSSDLSSRRIKEFENYQKYGGDLSDLSLEIASLDGKLKDFSSAYAEVKKNLGEAPITPEIISNIEHYVELLDKVRYLKSWNKSDDKDIIAQDESSAKYFLDSAIYKAQEQNYNYTDSLKTQEIQAIATAEAEKKLAETQKEVSFTSSETNISLENSPKKDAFPKTDSSATNASTSAIKEENNALGQTAQSAEKAINSKKKFANANKEVKDSANASVGAIKDENNAFDKNKWDKNVKAIQKYMDAVTELNHLKAKDKGTGKNASVIADQEQEVERLKNIAYEAKKTLSSIANSNKADVNTWEKWVNVMKQFNQASQGSTRSIARLEDAMRNANNSQIEYMNSVIKRFQNSYDKYSTDASRNGYNPSVEFSDKLSSFNSSLNDLKNLSSSISNGEFVKQEQIDSFKRITQNAEEAQKALKNMSASEKGMKSVSVQKEIDKINQLLRENTRYSKEAKIELRSLITQLMSGDPTVNLEAIHTKVMEIKNAEELAGRAGKNFFDILASKSYYGFIGQMQSYLSMYVGFYGMMNSIKGISSAVIQLNSDITELSKVSSATSDQIYDDFSSYADIAKDIGGTISDTISATADWSRNGYSIPDSKELARVALLYKNVGDGIDIDSANKSLISTLRGFEMEADEAEKIIDIYNNVSNNEPIDSGGIGEAMQRSAASFNAANTSLQESVALISTTNSVVQNPEKVGNMWKVVSMRIRSATAELEEAGEDTDGVVKSTADLQKMIKSMTGYDILEKDGKTFKSIYNIVLNISKVWNKLSDTNQSALLQALAGKQQSNALSAALSNTKLLEKSYQEAMNSAGSAAEEEKKYQTSIKYSIEQNKAKLEELSNDFLSSDLLKGVIDACGKFIDILDIIISKLHLIPTLLGGIGAGIAIKNVGEHYIVPVSI
jgi:TP901 family phage tail tape measure protein|nr:MAG TPA: minor tail protein [Caudoviricetes sp.]